MITQLAATLEQKNVSRGAMLVVAMHDSNVIWNINAGRGECAAGANLLRSYHTYKGRLPLKEGVSSGVNRWSRPLFLWTLLYRR